MWVSQILRARVTMSWWVLFVGLSTPRMPSCVGFLFGLTRLLVLEPEIHEPADAVVERRLPALHGEPAYVVGPHHRSTARTAPCGRLEASEVAHVETPVPGERAVYGAHRAPR